MKRFTLLLILVGLLVPACSSGATPTSTPAVVPTASPARITAAPTAASSPTPEAVTAAVSFDGTSCTYTGPTDVPFGSAMTFSLVNTPAALVNSIGAALVVVPVNDGTTAEQIVTYFATHKATDPNTLMPSFAINPLPLIGPLYPTDPAKTLTGRMLANLYAVYVATAPNETDKGYFCTLLKVFDRSTSNATATLTPTATTTALPTTVANTTAAPTATAYGPVSVVSGMETCPTEDLGTVTGAGTTVQHSRNGVWVCEDKVNDPRVTGTMTGTWNIDYWGTPDTENGALVQWGSGKLTAAGGTWEGRATGVYSSDRGDIIAWWWTGKDGFAGLTYFELATGKSPWALEGQIFPGSPPQPTSVAPPTTTPTAAPTAVATAAVTSKAITYGPVSVVSGTLTCPSIDFGPVTTDADGVQHARAGTIVCDAATNDPRVTGTSTDTWSVDYWGSADHTNGALVQWGSSRLDTAGGEWVGTYSGVYSSDRGDTIVYWYTGTGAYEGLTYFELVTGAGGLWTIRSQIYPGSPPQP